MDPDWLLKSKCIDVNVMSRLEMAVEWREELGAQFESVVQLFLGKATEMYIGLPWYKQLTPRACSLIEERHER